MTLHNLTLCGNAHVTKLW